MLVGREEGHPVTQAGVPEEDVSVVLYCELPDATQIEGESEMVSLGWYHNVVLGGRTARLICNRPITRQDRSIQTLDGRESSHLALTSL